MRPLRWVALAAGKLGRLDALLADCAEAIEIEPRYAPAYTNRSVAHRMLGDWRAVVADCDAWLRVEPRSGQVQRGRPVSD